MPRPKTSTKHKTLTVYLKLETIERLTQIAKEERKSRNSLITEIIQQAIRTKEIYNEHAWIDRIKRLVQTPTKK